MCILSPRPTLVSRNIKDAPLTFTGFGLKSLCVFELFRGVYASNKLLFKIIVVSQ